MIRRVLILGRMISWWLRIDTRYEVMKGCCVCIHVFRVIPTDRIFSTESLCTDIYIHRNYMNNLFFQRAYHIIFIRDLSDVWKLFRKSSYIATRYRDVTCHIIANCVSSFVRITNFFVVTFRYARYLHAFRSISFLCVLFDEERMKKSSGRCVAIWRRSKSSKMER